MANFRHHRRCVRNLGRPRPTSPLLLLLRSSFPPAIHPSGLLLGTLCPCPCPCTSPRRISPSFRVFRTPIGNAKCPLVGRVRRRWRVRHIASFFIAGGTDPPTGGTTRGPCSSLPVPHRDGYSLLLVRTFSQCLALYCFNIPERITWCSYCVS